MTFIAARRPRLSAVALAAALALIAPRAFAQGAGGGIDWANLQLPPDFLTLSDLTIFNGSTGGMMATATTTLLNSQTNVLLATDKASGTTRNFILGLKPDDWSLTQAFPALANPLLDSLKLNHIALVVTNRGDTADASQLADAEYAFYQPVYGTPDFTLILQPGVNLIAAIPLSQLPPDSPLLMAFKPLGMQPGPILLQGTLGKSLTLVGGGGGGLTAIKDLFLSAALPPMRPPGAPDWFIDGQLSLQLTGQPSVALVGDVTVKIKTDTLTFFLASTIAKTGLSLSGGLAAAHPWVAPFGIDWLTLNKVVLELGITPAGSVDLGFGGDLIIGKKDMDVAVALAVNASGVPTNFMISGNSAAGFGIADLIALQQQMAKARAAAAKATGQSGSPAPKIPLDAIPDIEFRDVGLKFAPKDDPALDVTRGMAIKGQMWIPTGQGDQLKNFASVDVNASADGFWARGDLGAFTLGPLVWNDAKLDLTLTPQDQHLIVKGDAKLFKSEQAIDLTMSRKELKFHTTTQLFDDMFNVTLDANAKFDLRHPSFDVDGVAQNDLGQVLGPIMGAGLQQFAAAGANVIGRADDALDALQKATSAGQTTVAQLRKVLETQRADAHRAWSRAQAAANRARRAANAALNARNAAYNTWQGTPRRRFGLRAARRAAYFRARVAYGARAAAYGARAGEAAVLKRIYDAIPPVDRNIVLMRADQALARLREQMNQAATALQNIKDNLQRIDVALANGAVPFTIEHAEVHAKLDNLMQGAAVRWVLDGQFVGQPFHVDQKIDFGDMHGAAAQLISTLTRGTG